MCDVDNNLWNHLLIGLANNSIHQTIIKSPKGHPHSFDFRFSQSMQTYKHLQGVGEKSSNEPVGPY